MQNLQTKTYSPQKKQKQNKTTELLHEASRSQQPVNEPQEVNGLAPVTKCHYAGFFASMSCLIIQLYTAIISILYCCKDGTDLLDTSVTYW